MVNSQSDLTKSDESKVIEILGQFKSLPFRKRWVECLKSARSAALPAVALRSLHKRCSADLEGPAPIWFPELATEPSQVSVWQQELALTSYDQFHAWSVQDRADFWRQAVDRLDIQFTTRSKSVLDLELGVAKAAWFPESTLNIVNSCFRAPEDAIALIAQKANGPLRSWTVKQLRQNASRVANGLVDAGFRVGDAIGVFMPMTDWSVAIYLGVIMAGCHVVSIADSFAPPEIETRLRISNAKAIFTYDIQVRSGKRLDLFRKLTEATDATAIVLPQGDTLDVDLRDQDRSWDEFLPQSRTEFEPVVAQTQETINVLFSSGTTGEPKAIPWNQLTPIKCAIDGMCHHNLQAGDVCCWPTNLGWMMGPWLIFASLINRATIALYEDAPVGPGFGQFIQDAKVTMLGVVPTLVKTWESSGDMESYDWSNIKAFSSTGESSQALPMTYLSSLAGFKPIIEYCGGTEIGGGYVSSVMDKPNFPAAFNTPAVGLDFVLISSEEGGTNKIGNNGEVFLVPPSIGLSNRLINRDHFSTYFEGTPSIEGHPQLRRHGDHFQQLETAFGPVFVAGGRVDDTMNLGGIKTSSAEIERVLNRCEVVLETAAVTYSTDGPDQLCVFAVVEPQTTIDPTGTFAQELQKEMNAQLKRQLNPLFRVTTLKIVNQLPRTASGKVMRRKLRSELEN